MENINQSIQKNPDISDQDSKLTMQIPGTTSATLSTTSKSIDNSDKDSGYDSFQDNKEAEKPPTPDDMEESTSESDITETHIENSIEESQRMTILCPSCDQYPPKNSKPPESENLQTSESTSHLRPPEKMSSACKEEGYSCYHRRRGINYNKYCSDKISRDMQRGLSHGSLIYDKSMCRLGFDQPFTDRYDSYSSYRYGRSRYRGSSHWSGHNMNYFNGYSSYGGLHKNSFNGTNPRGRGSRYRGSNCSHCPRILKSSGHRKHAMAQSVSPNPSADSIPGARPKNYGYSHDVTSSDALLDVKITVDKYTDASFANCEMGIDSDFIDQDSNFSLESLDLRTIQWSRDTNGISKSEEGYVVHFHINPGTSVTFTNMNGEVQRVSGKK